MSSTRNETFNKRQARFRNAEARKCPKCERKAALSTPIEIADDVVGRIGSMKTCLYCGHEVGIILGVSFGRSSSPAATIDEAQDLGEAR